MKPISFVARGGAGSVDRGSVSADQNLTVIQTSAGGEYSFNLRQSDIVGYKRSGPNLEIALADGRVILLENFFDGSGAPVAKLYVSADTYISEVTLVDGANGELYGQYGVAETWGKYGAGDDLIFVDGTEVAHAGMGQDDEVSMLGAGLLSGLGGGLGTAAAVAGGAGVIAGVGGGGGGGGTPAYVAPTVDDGTVVIGGDDVTEAEETVVVTGTAQPGSDVEVTIGDNVVTVQPDENGDWEATFEGEDFPDDGEYTVDVVVTEEDGTVTELTGPGVTIDLTGPEIVVNEGVKSTDDLFNAEGHSDPDGIVLSGSGEAGASLTVTIDGVVKETVVGEDGSWSVSYTSGEVKAGEYESDVTIVSTDSYGNSTTVVETIVVDTVGEVAFTGSNAGSDGVINFSEHGDGVTLTGTSQPGSTLVTVSLDGIVHEATVAADGSWSVTYSASEVKTGDYTGQVIVNAVDAAGNASSTAGTVEFDTLVENYTINTTTGGSDGIVSATEATSGVNFGGTVEAGSTVMVNFAGIDREATVVNGQWSVSFSESELPQSNGDSFTMTATATDLAMNTSELTQDVVIDNMAGSLTLSSAPIEGNNIVNADEASDGVTVRGTSDPGNMIEVKLGDATMTVKTDAAGNWKADFASSQLEDGQYDAPIIATTTDAAGNVREVTGTVEFDTVVRDLAISGVSVTDDNIINSFERDDGVGFSGTTEAGSTSVIVSIGGQSVPATVDAAGNWSVVMPTSSLPEGESSFDLRVDVIDKNGNTNFVTREVQYDTLVNKLDGGAELEGSNAVYNASEVSDGIVLSGQVEAGSEVAVEFGGVTYDATVVGGNWTLELPAEAFDAERYDAEIIVNAKDEAGNVDSIKQTISIDAELPNAPEIFAETNVDDGYGAVWVRDSDDTQAVFEVEASGNVNQIADDGDAMLAGGNNIFAFDSTVPDGSHLVVTATDDAGNVSGTFMALDDPAGSNIDMSSVNPNLAGLEIEAIDLTFAEDTNLTLSLDQIEAFAENSNTLAIDGGDDDTVTITGATKTTGTVTENGQTYDVYTIGEDATVLIDDDVNVVI
ncbi:Ig-like domain-containing protein [Lentibacter sp. XHP0401]|uniref:Ig-like domain-containing protein n=1 Tax=Lentibacter sp. XHP0401 TaxID=2984334 RepID=UPI0021E87227|nr:Ig-like domain-containing protein [Lentibacter sp. XHP0401]MCV2893298.1 Ig-like domain-containing protein [Lentibacter sp. XHP0401]